MMTVEFDTRLYRDFVAVARTGSLGRAARVLGRTQPALSQSIKRLEDLVGTPLFVRSRAGMVTTPAGKELLPGAERLLELHDSLLGGRREAVLFVDPNLATPEVRDSLKDARLAYPNLRVAVGRMAALRPGEYALTETRRTPAGAKVIFKRARRLRWVGTRRLSEPAKSVPLLLWAGDCAWRDAAVGALERSGLSWHVAFESRDPDALGDAARRGIGLMTLPPETIPAELRAIEEGASVLPEPLPIEIGLFGEEEHAHGLTTLFKTLWSVC